MNPLQISVQDLAELIDQKADFFLLDVRSPEENQQFNIGGRLIPLPELTQSLSEIPTDKSIVIYCRSGHRSHIALEILRQAGFTDVRNLVGGVIAWVQTYGMPQA